MTDSFDRVKLEWLANRAAELGEPDVLEIARLALDGDEHCRSEALQIFASVYWQQLWLREKEENS